jgi:Zn-dependent protease/CBS domain-containing protein
MGSAFKIGRFSGIDVRVHWTFFLLLAFFAFIGYQASGSPLGALTAAVTIVALFLCVLLHEFGHSLVAQRLGIEIHSITLLPIGGVSNLESLPEKPADEVKISVAGPLVSVVLALLFFGVGLLLGAVPRVPTDLFTGWFGSVGQFFFYLGYLNAVLAVFNLLPAFPLDGGRILRGLLATRLGAVRATDVASVVGQVFAAAFFLVGLLSGDFLLALVAVFIFFGASGEAQMVRQRELTRGLTVSDVMGTKHRTETVTPNHTFGQVLELVLHGYQEDFPVLDDGKLVGVLTRNEIMTAAHSPERYSSVRDLMKTNVPTISSQADLFEDGLRILQQSGLRALPVTENGELVGMLTIEDVGQASLLRPLPRKTSATAMTVDKARP